MADDQAKFDLKIGLQVEGGDSAAQRVAKLTQEIGKLEKNAQQLRGLANSLNGVSSAAESGAESIKGMRSQTKALETLKPAIAAVRSELAKQNPRVLESLGLDQKSINEGLASVSGFKALAKKISAARESVIDKATDTAGRAVAAARERAAIVDEARAIQRIRDKVAQQAVAQDRATEMQRTQATMAAAQQRIAVTKQAAVQSSEAELQAQRTRLAGSMRQVLGGWAQSPFGPANRPTLRELQGGSQLPLADKRLTGQTAKPTSEKSAGAAEKNLGDLASAARDAAAALRSLPKAISTGVAADKKAMADYHKQLRVAEAQTYPKSAYARRQAGGGGGGIGGPGGLSGAYDGVSNSASRAAASISRIKTEQDAITGQIKNVLGMAFGYQAIHAVAQQLQQVFGHLKGGVIEFNSMLEQATVGFTTLFENQERAAKATNAILGENKVGIDYIASGYNSASDAANQTIETIRQFANVTPFRFAELQEATIRMKAFGFDMAEILREDSKSLDGFSGGVVSVGNAVAALGGGADAFRRITYALGQMKQAGRVYQNDMMQLANAGIGGYRYLAEDLMKEITKDGSGKRAQVKAGYEAMYNQLESNAIETVRRLTTNGQISGEAAARAIMKGLDRDFGGGMAKQAKTFVGAFSTVADMSQSLVAESFKPLYDSIRDVTYQIGTFLQKPEVRERAKEFGATIKKIVDGLSWLGTALVKIGSGIATEFGNAMQKITDKTNSAGQSFMNTFGGFVNGLKAVVQFLENDYARAVAEAILATKLIFAFAQSNPMLSQLILVVTAIGMFKSAIDQNLFGIGDAFRDIVKTIEPIIAMIRDELIPAVVELGGTFVGSLFTVIIGGLRLIEPGLKVLLNMIKGLLDVLLFFKVPLQGVMAALALAFASKLIIGGIMSMRSYMLGFVASIERATVRLQALVRLMQMQQTLAGTSAINTVTGAGKMGGLSMSGGKMMGIGFAGEIGASLAESAGLIDPGTAKTLNDIFGALAMFGILKSVFPVAMLGEAVAAIGAFGGAIATFIAGLLGVTAATVAVAAGVAVAIIALTALVAWLLNQDANKTPEEKAAEEKRRRDVMEKRNREWDAFTSRDTQQQQSQNEFRAGERQNLSPEQAFQDFRKGERESWTYPLMIKQAKSEMGDLVDSNKLLVNQQKSLNTAQEKYNALLAVAKQQLSSVTALFEQIATDVLNDLINPQYESPYKLDQGVLLDYEELLKLEQELGFTQFTNAEGITRNFGEYKDILDSILPLSEDETAAGEISLKQVQERLKIEKERRKEQERIKALAQAEYDLGLATLQQYNESIDPLQRAIQLRDAQKKYETDINDLRMQGLEDLVDQATSSRDWARLTKATDERLKEWKKGQQLILDEMKRMFEDYNSDIAAILADPTLSDAQKKTAIETRLAQLKTDLASQFGVTEELINAKISQLQSQINTVTEQAGIKGHAMMVLFGNSLVSGLTTSLQGGFAVLMDFMQKKLWEVVDLAAKIKAAAAGAANAMDNEIARKKAEYLAEAARGLAKYANSPQYAGETFAELKKLRDAIAQSNTFALLDQNLLAFRQLMAVEGFSKYASGGMLKKNQISLVGEKGPELVLPQSRGLVLNNSITSRLLSMLGGGGAAASVNNVTINVNNPVVRSDADIRKLAAEISRAQASQFRTEGGRL